LPMSMKSLLPVMAAKRLPPICSKIVFAIIFILLWVLCLGGADTA
jgi:hypothetical protein